MDKIAKTIQMLRERGEDEARRQMSDLEYNGRISPDDDPVIDSDGFTESDDDDRPDEDGVSLTDEEDDRLPSERFYNPRREY